MDQITTCGGGDCSICSFFQSVNNLFHFLMNLSLVVAVLMTIVGGFFYIFGFGDEKKIKKAKRIIFSATGGLISALLCFLVVATIFSFLQTPTNNDGWYQFSCVEDRLISPNENNKSLASKKLEALITNRQKTTPINLAETSSNDIITSLQFLATGDKIIFQDSNPSSTLADRSTNKTNSSTGNEILSIQKINTDQFQVSGNLALEDYLGYSPSTVNQDELAKIISTLQKVTTSPNQIISASFVSQKETDIQKNGSYIDQTEIKKNKTCQEIELKTTKCPASGCEGDVMMIYPESVTDSCLDTTEGAKISHRQCVGQISNSSAENQKCKNILDNLSEKEKADEANRLYNKNKTVPDWYDKILNDNFGKGSDVPASNGGEGNGGEPPKNGGPDNNNEGTPPGPDNGQLPPDQGAGNFSPSPSFQELKECIGLKDKQIPYNGILVVLLNPVDPLNKNYVKNISKIFYLSRKGELIGKNGAFNEGVEGQEYGARDFKKGLSNDSMWGRGWKIFKGPTIYFKNSINFIDKCSYGSHDGYKTGTSNDPLNPRNLFGGPVTSMSRCGQHSGEKNSSAGCATMGNNSRCGFVNKSKEYMSASNGTIMQINLVGEMNPINRKFSSPDCGKINYCSAKKAFENNPNARQFHNNPNDGYKAADERRVGC